MVNHNRMLTDRAQDLRRGATKQEKHLWYDFLCQYPLRFRRQVTVDNYILDFYCSAAGLAVELDGSQHYTEQGKSYDRERTAYLEGKYGILILRIANSDVDRRFEGVCEYIDNETRKRYKA